MKTTRNKLILFATLLFTLFVLGAAAEAGYYRKYVDYCGRVSWVYVEDCYPRSTYNYGGGYYGRGAYSGYRSSRYYGSGYRSGYSYGRGAYSGYRSNRYCR